MEPIGAVGVVGGAVFVVVVISIFLGERAFDNSEEGGSAASSSIDPCAGCKAARRFWKKLKWWKKAAYAAWWAYKKAQCMASGCAF